MSAPGGAYSGTDLLEVLVDAANYNRHLLRLVEAHLPAGGHAVEFGAGIGTFAHALARRGAAVTCIEPDPALRARIAAGGLPALESLDALDDASLPYVFTLNVLEHIADDSGALRLIARKLMPGGTLFVYVPAFPCLYSGMDRKVGHLRRYRLRPLAALVCGAGLAVLDARHVDSLGFAAALAFRLLGRSDGTFSRRGVILYDRVLFPASRTLDLVVSRWFGKNIALAARKPEAAPPA